APLAYFRLDKTVRGYVPTHDPVPSAKPDLPFSISIDFDCLTYVLSAGSRQRSQFLAIPPQWSAIPRSDPHYPVGFREKVLHCTHRSSIRGPDLDETFGVQTKQAVVRSHPHPSVRIPSSRV